MDDTSFDYKKAGVDVEAGYEAVKKMKPFIAKTMTEGVLGGFGSFGGMFEIPKGYDEPVLISGTDGVGTKLDIAFMTGVHNTIGIDCVAMCVNDIVCHGAKPLFFLDYIGTGFLETNIAASIVEGVAEGCVMSGCALIGGETAEMPGFYKKGEYDVAGFAVGIAEKSKIINGRNIKPTDVLIGIESSGIHSNGFTLVRKICFDHMKLEANDFINELDNTIGKELLTPTKIYTKLINQLTNEFDIKGISHITGGGWIENIPRMFNSDSLKAVVRKSNHKVPVIFDLLKKWGNVTEENMYKTFNMGIGMVIAIDEKDKNNVINKINSLGEKAYEIGKVYAKEDNEESIIIE